MQQLTNFLQDRLGLSGNTGLLVELFLVVLVVVVINTLVRFALWRLHARLEQTDSTWDNALVDAFRRPLFVLTWVLGLTLTIEMFHGRLDDPAPIFDFVAPFRSLAVIVLLAWFLFRLIVRVENNLLTKRDLSGRPYDRTTMDAVGKLLRLTVAITTTLVAMQTLGINISGILAFGGVGGIAVGFAARDLLANFFGGLTVYMDRPFNVGDWIRSPEREIEGVVEQIGWRQTRIRTFDQRPLYVPNSTFSTVAVENPSRMLNRRIFENVGIRYADAGKLERIVTAIQDMIRAHPDLETAERTMIINFTRFGASSLDIMLYCFTRTTNWVEFHTVKQDVLYQVLRIIEAHGAKVAFPTTTLHVPEGIRISGDPPAGGGSGERAVPAAMPGATPGATPGSTPGSTPGGSSGTAPGPAAG